MRHVDESIDDPKSDAYASWVLAFFRFPALHQLRWATFMKRSRLFCT